MQFTVYDSFNGSQEAKNANQYDKIRLFTSSLTGSVIPIHDLKGIEQNWSVASEHSVGYGPWSYFSATCWYFGRNVYQKVNVPIGLIVSSYGGTNVELWMSPEPLELCKVPYFSQNSHLWNAMINPFTSMTIYGAIWYQGEQNTCK